MIYIYINFHYYYDLLIMLILHKYIYIYNDHNNNDNVKICLYKGVTSGLLTQVKETCVVGNLIVYTNFYIIHINEINENFEYFK